MVQGGPMQPVYRGEIAGCCLGVDVAAYDEKARPVVGELGELVIRSADALDADRLLGR